MSSSSVQSQRTNSKFTSGEKCIFTHLVITFSIILALVIIYFVHLCLVQHGKEEVFKITRRSNAEAMQIAISSEAGTGAGAVIVNLRYACGCLLVRRAWSAAPAHCVAARAEPDLADLLPTWLLRYRTRDSKLFETGIARGIVHSHFSRDDFRNNIGLLEHAKDVLMDEFKFSEAVINAELLMRSADQVSVLNWQDFPLLVGGGSGLLKRMEVTPLSMEDCRQQMSSIQEIRDYELCVALPAVVDHEIGHGSALVLNSDIIGIFAWGDKRGYMPLVIININNFKEWILNIVNVY